MRTVVQKLMLENAGDSELTRYYTDVMDHIQYVNDRVKYITDWCNDLVQNYAEQVNHEMNQVVYTLTLVYVFHFLSFTATLFSILFCLPCVFLSLFLSPAFLICLFVYQVINSLCLTLPFHLLFHSPPFTFVQYDTVCAHAVPHRCVRNEL